MRRFMYAACALLLLAGTVGLIAEVAGASGTAGTTYGDTRLVWKAPVVAATTADITLSGAQTIDGVSVVALDAVLVKDQSTASENGIYIASATAWSRRRDFVETAEKALGSTVFVTGGTLNNDLTFVYTSSNTFQDAADISGAVTADLFDAQTILAATTDNTPAAVTVAAGSLVGRTTAGNVGALTGAQVWAELTGDAAASVSMNSQGFTSLGPVTGATTYAGSGTVTLGATVQGTLHLLEASANGTEKAIFASPAALTQDVTIAIPDAATVTLGNIAVNTTHLSSDGSDHTFLDQSVISGATPTFTTTNFSGALSSITTYAGSGTMTLGATTQGTLHILEASANGVHKAVLASPAALTQDVTIAIPDSATVTLGNIAVNTTHLSSDGSDHTFLDQSVISGGSPTFLATNFSGALSGITTYAGSGTMTLGAASAGTLELLEPSGGGPNKVTIAAPALTGDVVISIPDANVTLANIAVNTTHLSSDGSDHTFLDQSVISGATPTFTTTNFSGALASITTISASGTVALGGAVAGTIELFEPSGGGTSKVTIAAPALGSDRTITVPDADVTLANIAVNTTHTAGDGTDHSAVAAIVAENTDGQHRIALLNGGADGGTWAKAVTSGGLATVTRTAADAPDSYWAEFQLPNRTAALKGIKPTGLRCNYTVNTADCTDLRFEVWKVTQGANGAARTAAELFGAADGDYDADHNTSAERCLDTAGPQLHLAVLIDAGTPAYVGASESLILRTYVDGDAGAASVVILTDCLLEYSETLVDGS